MLGFRRIMVFLAMMIMVATFAVNTASAVGYVTIADIKEEAQDGWHESFLYKGKEIKVDVDVAIPSIDKVAVLRIKWPEHLVATYAPVNADIFACTPAGFGYSVMSKPNSLFTNTNKPVGIDRYVEDGAQAENSPLSAAEALAFAKQELEPYVESLGGYELELSYMDAWSRQYEAIDRTNSGDILDYSKPLTEMGYYEIRFNQTFQGIPYTQHDINFENSIKAESNVSGGAMGEVFARVGSKDNYSLLFTPAQFDGVLVDDLPLASFSDIQNEIQMLIENGYVRDIYWLRLVYVRLYNPLDIGNTWVLFPVWELNGDIVQNSSAPASDYTPNELAKLKKIGGTKLLINAQTGKYYNVEDTSPDRSYAKYLTWDEVK